MIIPESIYKDISRLTILWPLKILVRKLPPGKDISLIKFAGRNYYYIEKNKARTVKNNIRKNLSKENRDMNIKEIAKKNFETHFLNQYLYLIFSKIRCQNIKMYHDFNNIEYVDLALKYGKGCIILHGHYGPAQLPLVHFSVIGFPITQIGYHHDGKGLSRIGKTVQKKKIGEEKHYLTNIIMVDAFLRPIIKSLRNNEIIMVTGDGIGGGKSIGKYRRIDFFKKKALFPEGPVKLAKKTGAALIPAFTVPEKNNRYITIFEKPIEIIYENQSEKATDNIIQEFAIKLQQYVSKYPYQWHFWDEFK